MSQSITDRFNDLTDATREYIDATVAFHRLDLYKKSMIISTGVVHKVFVGFVLMLGLIFLSVALAIYLGALMNSVALGYAVVGLLYIIFCAAILYLARPAIERWMLRKSSTKLFNAAKNIQSELLTTEKETYEDL